MLILLSLLCLLTSIWPLFDTSHYALELLEQARLHLIIAYALILLLCLWCRQIIAVLIMVGLVAFNLYWIYDSFTIVPKQEAAQADKRFRVLSFNVYEENWQPETIVPSIMGADPDVVVIVEAARAVKQMLESQLASHYPFRFPEGAEGANYDWAIFSKHPLEGEFRKVKEGSSQIALYGAVNAHGRTIQLFGLHTLSPRNAYRASVRNVQLRELAEHIVTRADPAQPVIVAGDFNTVPWHAGMRDFQRVARLVNADDFWSMTLTWPSWLPSPLNVPIDHILHSTHFCSDDKQRLSASGSDHYPVYADLYLCN